MANRSNHAKYTEDSQYKYGIGFFRREGAKIKETVRYCVRCGKDLKNAGRYSWVVHHKDHNRKNSVLSVEKFGETASKETTQEKKQSLLF